MSSAGDWEGFRDAFGGRVQARRKELGLTQEELAGLADVDRKHISSIETGKAEPRISTYAKIAESLNMPRPPLLEDFDWIANEGRLKQRDH